MGPLPSWELFEQLAVIMAIVVDFSMIFFGNNPIGLTIGLLISTVIAFVPCVIFDLLWSFYVVDNFLYVIVDIIFGFNMDEALELLGVFGVILLELILLPVLMVMTFAYVVLTGVAVVIGLPVVILLLWQEIVAVMDM